MSEAAPAQRPNDATDDASRRAALGFALAGVSLAGLFGLLSGSPTVAGIGLLASIPLGVGVTRHNVALAWTGLATLGATSLGVTFAGPLGWDVVVFLAVAGALYALAATALGEADRVPVVRPRLASQRHRLRWLGLAALWLVLVTAPLLFAPTRLALASEMGTTLAVLLATGATVLVYVLPLAALHEERKPLEAGELQDRNVRFGVREIRPEGRS